MNAEQPNTTAANSSIEQVSDGEQKLCEVRKHPFGIIMLYLQVGFGLAAALGLLYFLVPQFVSVDNPTQLNNALLLITIVTISLALITLFFASVVYHQSYLIMTNKNVTQVLQKSLFKRQVSELSMANVEDVTAHQNGIFATLFNFGELVVETAGEQNNFTFNFCPRPNYYGKILLDARQRYVESDPVRASVENRRLNLPAPPRTQSTAQSLTEEPQFPQLDLPPLPPIPSFPKSTSDSEPQPPTETPPPNNPTP